MVGKKSEPSLMNHFTSVKTDGFMHTEGVVSHYGLNRYHTLMRTPFSESEIHDVSNNKMNAQ